MRPLALILAFFCLALSGCGGAADSDAQLGAEDYGELPGLRQVPHQPLRDELDRLIEEEATPEQLSSSSIDPQQNVAVGLLEIFPEARIQSIREAADALHPDGPLQFGPAKLQKVIAFRRLHDSARLSARKALGRQKCDFGIQFKAGILAQLKFKHVVWSCARLESFYAAESLADGKPDQAVESLDYILRLARWLGQEKHLTARLEAAYLRTQVGFTTAQAIVKDRRTRRQQVVRMHDLVQQTLQTWPDDAWAWIGDRSDGLYTYEMVRAGDVTGLLTAAEMEQFAKEKIIRELDAAAEKGIDEDQLFYLQAMRKVIKSCSQPYYQRIVVFDEIDDDLQARADTPDFPMVAARLLWPGIREAHTIQAQDRANWEAWVRALALALQRPAPPYAINPLTGKPYREIVDGQIIVVDHFGSHEVNDNPNIVVPVFAN